MHKAVKRLSCLILALFMVLAVLPAGVFAEAAEPSPDYVEGYVYNEPFVAGLPAHPLAYVMGSWPGMTRIADAEIALYRQNEDRSEYVLAAKKVVSFDVDDWGYFGEDVDFGSVTFEQAGDYCLVVSINCTDGDKSWVQSYEDGYFTVMACESFSDYTLLVNGNAVTEVGNEDVFDLRVNAGWLYEPESMGIVEHATGDWYYLEHDMGDSSWGTPPGTAYISGMDLNDAGSWGNALTPGEYSFLNYCWDEEAEQGYMLYSTPFTVVQGHASQETGDPYATLVFDMTDSGLDMWTYNYIEVLVNGVSAGRVTFRYDEMVLGDRVDYAYREFPVPAGSNIRLKWGGGTWPNECGFTVSYKGGPGIYSRAAGSLSSDAEENMITFTADAQYANYHKVTFHKNDGAVNNAIPRLYFGVLPSERIAASGHFIRTGRTIQGWAASENGDIVYAPNVLFAVTGDMDLYAVWNKIPPTAADISFSPAAVTYNGSAQPVNAAAGSNVYGLGAITVYYTGTGGTVYDKSTAAPAGAGSYTITADVAEGPGYFAANGLALGTYTINRKTPVAADLYYVLADVEYNGSAKPVTVTAKGGVVGLGGITVKYNGSSVAPSSVGTYTVTADLGTGSNYTAATGLVLGSFQIKKIDQTITWNQANFSATVGDGQITLDATASSGLPVSYSSSNASVASISGNILTIVGAGTATITAVQTGNEVYGTALPISKPITVEAAPVVLTGISITGAPAKTDYFVGEALNLAGLEVTASYSDGGNVVVTNYTTNPAAGAALTAANSAVTVSYEGFSASFDISVVTPEVTGISITGAPAKTDYFVGEALDLAGLEVTASYSDGGNVVVTGYTTSPENGSILNAAGTVTVTVQYAGKAAEFAVTVKEILPLTVSVTTPNLVETLAAYLNITVTGEELYGKEATVWLKVGEELLYGTPVVDGFARMFISAAPVAGNYELVVKTSDGLAYGSCTIDVTAYNTDIWVLNSNINADGYVTLVFNETVSAKDGKFDKEVTLNGKAVGCTLSADGVTLVTNVRYADLPAGTNTFTVTGVKYPRLFPSYSFTFAAEVII